MDRSLLAARIQDILKGRGRPARPEAGEQVGSDDDSSRRVRYVEESDCDTSLRVRELVDEAASFAARCAADEAASRVSDVLGGRLLDGPGGPCLVIDRDYPASHSHGRCYVARYAAAASRAMHALPWFLGGTPSAHPWISSSRLLFFDLETTGLSGGAGIYAFLVGCGRFDGDAFLTRQFFMRGYGEERALLDAVRAFVAEGAGARGDGGAGDVAAAGPQPCLVTYNGRSFDLPLIETRYLLHRRTSPFASLPHVDMLFPARRLWRRRMLRDLVGSPLLDRAALVSPADLRASCALTALEQDILGLRRQDDVPGWEIPTRYFGYARTGDARGLVAVLEHNRLDLLSLAAVSTLILELVVEHDRARDRHDCVALARLLEHLGRGDEAERCYERAAAGDGLLEGEVDRRARSEALHWLAIHRRRARRFGEAAEAWQTLLRIPGLDVDLRREACEALAIHHEHRARDLEAARSFALLALDVARGGRFAGDVEHRLGRLSRRLGGRRPGDEGRPTQTILPTDD